MPPEVPVSRKESKLIVELTRAEVDELIRSCRKVDAWVITRSAHRVEPSEARRSAVRKLKDAEATDA